MFPRCERILEMFPALVSSTISPFTSTKRDEGLLETRAEGLLSDIVGRAVRRESLLDAAAEDDEGRRQGAL